MDIFTPKKKLKGFKRIKFIRISDPKQDGKYQESILDKHYPGIKDFKLETCPGDTPLHERKVLSSIPKHRLVTVTHPDRLSKSHDFWISNEDYRNLLRKNIKVTFPNFESLSRSYAYLWNDLQPETYLDLILNRLKEMIPNEPSSYKLKRDELDIVFKASKDFFNLQPSLDHKKVDQKFLMVSSHLGKTINLIFEHRNTKARDLVDRTFGNEPAQILLAKALKDYEPYWRHIRKIVPIHPSDKTSLSLKELSSLLAKNRGLLTKNGTHYLPTNLMKVLNSRNFNRYSDFINRELDPIVKWMTAAAPHSKVKYDTVQVSDPSFKKALRNFPYSQLYRDQRTVLRKLLRGENTVYSTRTGGGKNDIPILYSYMKPKSFIVVVMPLRSLLDFYHSSLLKHKHFDPSEIGIFHSSHNKKFNRYIKSITKGTARIVLVTPDALQNEDSKLIDALAARGVDLFMVDECHHLLVSGKVRFRLVYLAAKVREVLKKLNHPLTLFTSATINKRVHQEIKYVLGNRDHEVVKGDLNRPNLKLFHLLFDNRGQKLLVLYSILKTMRRYHRRKGIIFFSSVSSLLKAHEVLSELRIDTFIYFGKIHRDYSAKLKGENLQKFINSRDAIMLTTASFGEGINIPNISFNVIFELPGSDIELLQWVGRAGRNGKRAPIILMDDGHGRRIRQSLIDSNTSVRGRKVQQKLYDNLLDLLNRKHKRKKKLSYSDLLSGFKSF